MYYRNHTSPLLNKSYDLGVEIVKMIKHCPNDWRLSSFYNQITKSGTSVGANINEAEFAQSPADFASKMSIALKEANETRYWLHILRDTDCISSEDFERLKDECQQVLAMLVASLKTVRSGISNG